MGLLDKFERGVEKAVKSPFAKAFRSEVQPVEIASAIRRAMDDRATVIAHGRTMVPNVFTIELSPNDFDRLDDFADTIGDDLIAAAQEHAEVQRYTPGGPIEVHLEEATDLATGVFRVNPETSRDGSAAKPQSGMPSASAPGPAPSAPAGSAAGPRPGMPSAQVPAPAQSSAAPVPAEPAASPSPASAAHSQKSSQSSDSEFARPAVDYPDALAEPDSDAADDAAEAVGGQAAGASSRPGIPEAFPAYPVPGSAHGHGAGAAAAASAGAAGAAGAAAGSSAAPAPAAPAPAPAAPQAQPQPSAIVPPSRRPVVNAARRPWLEIDQERYPLVGALTVIGRDALADIVLDDPGISRRHSEVRVTNDGPHLVTSIRDLGSTNGTFVNGERITSVRLQDGDRLTVGRTAVVFHAGKR